MRLCTRWTCLVALLFWLGCAPTYGEAYLNAFAAGERAYHAGRYEEAARAFDEAALKALRVKDRDEARLLQARSFQRARVWNKARVAYERLIADSPSGPRSARAEFELAELDILHGDADRGWAALYAAVRRHPKHGLARHAVEELALHEQDRGGDAAAVAWLRRQQPIFQQTELAQVVAYQLARALERSGDREEALRNYVKTARAHPYPSGALTDDALFRAAMLEKDFGRPHEAIALLRELLAPRETALEGSYQRPRFSEAQHQIAIIYRDVLHDRDNARREFHKLYAEHTTSILRDDALWAEARLWLEDANQEKTCNTASHLVREFSESRYTRCVHRLCPSLPAKDHPCADYILRELEEKNGDAEDQP